MKKAVILGAGAMGKKLAALLNKNTVVLLAYGDNNTQCHSLQGPVSIVAVEDALALSPAVVFIGVAGKERTQALTRQARKAGFDGEILSLSEGMAYCDLRAATLFSAKARLSEIPGDIAELGVYQGDFAWQLNLAFPTRTLHLFDTFSGFAAADLRQEAPLDAQGKIDFSDTSAKAVCARMPYPEQVVVHEGLFPQTAEGLETRFAFVSLDADLYAPTLAGLEYFMPRLASGGMIFVHDAANPRFAGVGEAIRAYEARHGALMLLPLPDLHGTAVILKP